MKNVAAAIIVRNGKIFIAQRPEGKSLAHHWEFPGGKLEEGETLPQCLKRELREELNIDADVGEYFMISTYDYEFGTIALNAFWVTVKGNGEVKSNEHENTAWVSPQELDNYKFAPADMPIVAKLKELKL